MSTSDKIEAFKAPTSGGDVLYEINALNDDIRFDYDGASPASTLDLTGVTQDLRISFFGPGQVRVERLDGSGSTQATLEAAGINQVNVGAGTRTFVLHEAGLGQPISVADNTSGDRHLIMGEGFGGVQTIVNNDSSTWTVDGNAHPGKSFSFVGGSLAAVDFSQTDISSLSTLDAFAGALVVNGVTSIQAAAGQQALRTGDTVQLSQATPSGESIATGTGDDSVLGSAAADTVETSAGNDQLRGESGADNLSGGAGDDQFWGGLDDDTLIGGPGNDLYHYDATGWGVDTVVEAAAEGDSDAIDFSAVNSNLVHVISQNNYEAFTGADHVGASQDRLTAGKRSSGQVQIYDSGSDSWSDFDATNSSHVDNGADRVSVANEEFQNIERIVASEGDNSFYFGNDWGPSAFGASAAGQLGGAAGVWLASTAQSFLSSNKNTQDRTLVVDSQSAVGLKLDFRQVTEALEFSFERETDGQISLTVAKSGGVSIPFLGADLIDDGDLTYNAIKFTHVDENTTVYGGRESNTFKLNGTATFAGTIVGGSGLRDWVADLIDTDGPDISDDANWAQKGIEWLSWIVDLASNVHGLMGGELPDLFVSNTIDNTSAATLQVEGDSLWDKAQSAVSSLFKTTSLRETARGLGVVSLSEGAAQSDPSKPVVGAKRKCPIIPAFR